MTRYSGPDASFDVPTDWEDRSVIAFSAPAKPNQLVPNVTLTKDMREGGESMADYVDRTLSSMAKQLAGFKLAAKKDIAIQGGTATQIVFTWCGAGGRVILQRLALAPGVGRGVLGINITCDESDKQRIEPLADRIIASMRVEQTGS